MAWEIGVGRGLSDFGQMIMQWAQSRQDRDWRTQQAALDRALQSEGRETQRRALEAQIARDEGIENDRLYKRELDEAELYSKYYGGVDITDSPEVANQIPQRFRPLLVKSEHKMVDAPMPEGMPIPAGKFQRPETRMSIRQPVTAQERITDKRIQSQEDIAKLRNDYLTKKLAQDKDLAKMANTLGYDRIKAMVETAGRRIEASLYGMDMTNATRLYEIDTDAAMQQLKIEAAKTNPFIAAIIQMNQGGAAGTTPAAPTPTPSTPSSTLPSRPPATPRPGGARPPAGRTPPADEKSSLDAILNRPRR